MSRLLSFKAQALDNTSVDHYQVGDELLAAEDEVRRREITNMISEVAREGTSLLKDDGAELFVQHRRFLAQVYSEQLDAVGRRAPILCCGELSESADPEACIQAIQSFAAKIGRTVEPGHIQATRQAIESRLVSQKKNRGRALSLAVGVGIAVLFAALILSNLHQGRR